MEVIFFFLFFISILSPLCWSAELSSVTSTPPPAVQNVADLVRRQTDTIKQIVSNHHQQQISQQQQITQQQNIQHHLQYPVVTKYPPDVQINNRPKNHNNNIVKTTDLLDKLSLDELRLKCQHLARLEANALGNNRTEAKSNQTPTTKARPTPPAPIGGFYVTAPPTTTTTPTATPSTPLPTPSPVKYIKLEPIILQKTILNDGRTIYYWHKSLPSAVQFVPPPPSTTTPSTTTTTTTTESSSYSFRNFFPSFYSIGAHESAGSVAAEKTSTTLPPPPSSPPQTSPQSPPLDNKGEELVYQQQLRFVVPLPYAPPTSAIGEESVRRPWDFDQYAYYPKPLQPDSVNVQVPYTPTFHVIKAVAVPNEHEPEANVGEH